VKTLILGLGNPILTDDGVGVRVARLLAEHLSDEPDVTVAEASVGGLRLLEIVANYDRLILVDAIQTIGGQPGEIHRLTPDAFCASLHSGCSHAVDLVTALELGRKLGMSMPEEIVIIAIGAEDVVTFGERCTARVEAAIPQAVKAVWEELRALR